MKSLKHFEFIASVQQVCCALWVTHLWLELRTIHTAGTRGRASSCLVIPI